ncbi:hypothetical protein OAS07_04065 [Candidatus Thioglobus sp.]|nr:hypothetical protein [Candidatus Thioglobus sp.]MDC0920161.1 hypothetical protein [Candidatus Thioglobus sp.]MDC0965544.1 hypothetical protein [Candidatus Thioglobus sp.]MDC1165657.1 hypothetical protein [Candidatus Thioglobus sp.]
MFKEALEHWDDDFSQYFKHTFDTLNLDDIPLSQHCSHSGVIDKESIEITILSKTMNEQFASLTIGVFFCEIVSGCACSDDPSQAMIHENSYAELHITIELADARIKFLD